MLGYHCRRRRPREQLPTARSDAGRVRTASSVESKDLLRIHRAVDGKRLGVPVIYHSHTHTEAYPSPTDVLPLPRGRRLTTSRVSLMDEV